MKFLCDVHLPIKLVSFFIKNGIEAVHGSTILDGWKTKDEDFANYADENNFIFITKDYDFRDSHFLQNTPRNLIKINLGNISNENLILIFTKYLKSLEKIFQHGNVYVELNKDSIEVLQK